jgi:hypothetical protein
VCSAKRKLVAVMEELAVLVPRMNETVRPGRLEAVGREQVQDFIRVVERMKILLEELEVLHLINKHDDLRWNPAIERWFCAKCGRISDHTAIDDARTELEQYECDRPREIPKVQV